MYQNIPDTIRTLVYMPHACATVANLIDKELLVFCKLRDFATNSPVTCVSSTIH